MKAQQIVDALVDSPDGERARWRAHMAATTDRVDESPQHFSSGYTYQAPAKFAPVNPGNFNALERLGRDGLFTYMLQAAGSVGYVFRNEDVGEPHRVGPYPIMHVSLRDSGIRGYMQAHHLRVMERYARLGAATGWYVRYVERFGGVVSDFEHLDGGKALWRSLVNTALDRGLRASLVNTTTGTWTHVNRDTADEQIWSKDASLRGHVLVLEKNGPGRNRNGAR